MSNIPIANLRLVGRNTDFLDRKVGSRGEIFYDQQQNELRLYDGDTSGGFSIARADQTALPDLSNVNNATFKNKAESAGVIGGATIDDAPPSVPQSGQLWFDVDTGVLYVYYNDGTSNQWVQPASIQYGGPGGGGGGATNLDALTDVTLNSPAAGQVLKYNGTAWINDTDATGAGGIVGEPNINFNLPLTYVTATLLSKSATSISDNIWLLDDTYVIDAVAA